MLANGIHQYSPAFAHLPGQSGVGHDPNLAPQHFGTTGLDALAHTSQYALHFEQSRHALLNRKGFLGGRQHPYVNGPIAAAPRSQKDMMAQDRAGRSATTGAPVRRRISRACDQCNQLRTKCDGKSPCAHCVGRFIPSKIRHFLCSGELSDWLQNLA
jgi:xylanolytic transcriptional activator XlnR